MTQFKQATNFIQHLRTTAEPFRVRRVDRLPLATDLPLHTATRLLDPERTGPRRRLVVQLLATGRFSVREHPIVNVGRDERVFLSALAIARWKRAAA